ncbi:MAG: hypothetical protein LBT62_03115, partial [Deltaproteobacteria bacterium]|nr:hypothetical protein [Deltaproteobacteria bacterium]
MPSKELFLVLVSVFLGFICMGLAPQYPEFWVTLLLFGLLLALFNGPKILSSLFSLFAPSKRRFWRTFLSLLLVLVFISALGTFTSLPLLNPAAPPQATLRDETLKLVEKIEVPVKIE